MMQVLKSLRDFMTDEVKKWLPGNFMVESCVLLRDNVVDPGSPYKVTIKVFDSKGTYIGEIEHPHWVPHKS